MPGLGRRTTAAVSSQHWHFLRWLLGRPANHTLVWQQKGQPWLPTKPTIGRWLTPPIQIYIKIEILGVVDCCHVTAIKGSQQLMNLDHAKKVSMPHISPYQGKHGETTFRRRTLAKNHFADRKIMPFWKTIRFLLVPCANNLALGSSISWWVCW